MVLFAVFKRLKIFVEYKSTLLLVDFDKKKVLASCKKERLLLLSYHSEKVAERKVYFQNRLVKTSKERKYNLVEMHREMALRTRTKNS